MSEDKSYSRILVTWTEPDIPPLSAVVALDSASPTELHIHRIYELAEDSVCALLNNLATSRRVEVLTIEMGLHRMQALHALCSTLERNRRIRSLEVVMAITDVFDRGLLP